MWNNLLLTLNIAWHGKHLSTLSSSIKLSQDIFGCIRHEAGLVGIIYKVPTYLSYHFNLFSGFTYCFLFLLSALSVMFIRFSYVRSVFSYVPTCQIYIYCDTKCEAL